MSPKGLSILYCVSIHWLFNDNWMKAGSIPQPQKTSDGQNRETMGSFQTPQLLPGVNLLSAQLGQAQPSALFSSPPQDNASEALQQGQALHDPAHISTLSELHTNKQKDPALPTTHNPTRKAEAGH